MAAVYTEFCCRSGGSNLNGGGLASGAEPATTAVYTSTNGNWNGGAGAFTPTDGSTPASTVTVGDFASIFLDGATVSVYIARVTAVAAGVNGAISFVGASIGTSPTTGATGRSIRVGGAWKGPNGAETFPFNLITGALTNSLVYRPRLNMKNDAVYAITAGLSTAGQAQPIAVQGYTTTFGDGGKAVIDGGTSGASYTLLTLGGNADWHFEDLKFQNNGATGSADGINCGVGSGGTEGNFFRHVVITAIRGSGFFMWGTGQNVVVECEIFGCNQSNTANKAGYDGNTGGYLLRNFIHHNVGSNTAGIRYNGWGSVIDNVIDGNGLDGLILTANSTNYFIFGNTFYANGRHGLNLSAGGGTWSAYIENNIFTKNLGYGQNLGVGGGIMHGFLMNNAYGSGSEANVLGATNISGSMIIVSDLAPLPNNVSPFVDAPNGDFRITIPEVKGVGRGAFVQTDSAHYTAPNTVGYPDVGAVQAAVSGGGPVRLVNRIGT